MIPSYGEKWKEMPAFRCPFRRLDENLWSTILVFLWSCLATLGRLYGCFIKIYFTLDDMTVLVKVKHMESFTVCMGGEAITLLHSRRPFRKDKMHSSDCHN
jgi:hypothetical protein